MNLRLYKKILADSFSEKIFDRRICRSILSGENIDILSLLSVSFVVRKKYFGKKVKIHILNNVQNGLCPEDCKYCAQSKDSKAPIQKYSIKSDEEIMAEAKNAYKKGAYRYCMVFSGKGPNDKTIDHLCVLVKKIKSRYPIQVCVSPGTINKEQAKKLKKAGLDRLNHNLNTSKGLYPNICTTHKYQDRLNTLRSAHDVGLQICSGVIIGMGEKIDDVIDMADQLKKIKAESIPINFFIPIRGTTLKTTPKLTPEYCLRVLCLFRLLNPKSEIRVAAGREMHLRDMEVMAFYPANSLFLEGYLNAKGSTRLKTMQMLKDAGFEIESDKTLAELLKKEKALGYNKENDILGLKGLGELRPNLTQDVR